MQGLLGTCHHTSNKSSNVADSKTTYLVGRSRLFSKFEYVYFSSLKIAPSMIDCRFLLEHPSCFISNINFLTQFSIIQKIEPYTDLSGQLIECWIVFIIHSHKRMVLQFFSYKSRYQWCQREPWHCQHISPSSKHSRMNWKRTAHHLPIMNAKYMLINGKKISWYNYSWGSISLIIRWDHHIDDDFIT